MTGRPTILDVARRAGVSKSTVSLVLNGSPLVREAKRTAVRQAMAELGYVYNRAAANLRGASTSLVGLVINDLRNPFFAEFATSAQMALSARGHATVVANTDEDAALQEQVVVSMLEHGVSALVLSPAYGATAATFDAIARAGVPAMQVLRRADPRTALFPFAAPDYVTGGRLAAEHLIGQGARAIAFVGGLPDRPVTEERMSGYRAALAAAGLVPLHLPGRPGRAFGRAACADLLAQHPQVTAAVCFNDLVALGMLTGLAERGLQAGTALRITGFDDIEEAAQAFPPLSSVRCDVAGFARHTAAQLLAWLEGGPPPPPERRSPVTMIARASSTGAPS